MREKHIKLDVRTMGKAIKQTIREHWLFTIMFVFFVAYYLHRMLILAPWYDELYTYLYFSSKGVGYSATHWPFPNNHIFFSMMSACLKPFGGFVMLRGISYLAAVLAILGMYKFFLHFARKNVAALGTMIYALMFAVNNLAVQGRGYSVATLFLIGTLNFGMTIYEGKARRRTYIGFGFCLYAGLYTLVSSIYWVAAVCVCFGLLLIMKKEFRTFTKLVITGIVAAVVTLISYTVMWLSIGAQQIIADETTGCAGRTIMSVIRSFPRSCLTRGMQFMLNDRSVQGIAREDFLRDFKYFYGVGVYRGHTGAFSLRLVYFIWGLIALFTLALFVIAYVKKLKSLKKFLPLIALWGVGNVIMFIVLLIQSAYPFDRVFSYYGVFLACLFVIPLAILDWGFGHIKFYVKISQYIALVVLILASIRFFQPKRNAEYMNWDAAGYDVAKHIDFSKYDTYMPSNAYAQMQVEFRCSVEKCAVPRMDAANPQLLIMDNPGIERGLPILRAEQIEYLMTQVGPVIYENDMYTVYEMR